MAETTAVYRRYAPPAGSGHVIEHLWAVEAPAHPRPVRELLIPNGRPTIVVALGELGVRHDPLTGTRSPNGNTLFGITTRPYVLEQRGASCYVGAQLRPYGLAALLDGTRLVDEFAALDAWLGTAQARALVADLAARPDQPARAAALGAAVMARCAPLPEAHLRTLEAMVALVDDDGGGGQVADLARRLHVSTSSLYRRCTTYLGVGPKRFMEVTRYYRFVGGLLHDAGGDTPGLLARLHGYYDQAHATRDFKAYTGVTPGTFATTLNGIARLMHAGGAEPSG